MVITNPFTGITINANPEGCNQWTGKECSGTKKISSTNFNYQDEDGTWHDWNVSDLHKHASSIPVTGEVDVSRLSIRSGLQDSRVDAASLDYPILMSDRHIVDGQHRIAKARKLGIKKLKYKLIDLRDVNESGRKLD